MEIINSGGNIVNDRRSQRSLHNQMELEITLRVASATDESFLLQLRKLTMTEHLMEAGVPTDDEAHLERIRSNFEDAKAVRAGEDEIGLLKFSRQAEANGAQFRALAKVRGSC